MNDDIQRTKPLIEFSMQIFCIHWHCKDGHGRTSCGPVLLFTGPVAPVTLCLQPGCNDSPPACIYIPKYKVAVCLSKLLWFEQLSGSKLIKWHLALMLLTCVPPIWHHAMNNCEQWAVSLSSCQWLKAFFFLKMLSWERRLNSEQQVLLSLCPHLSSIASPN